MNLISGKIISEQIKEELLQEIKQLQSLNINPSITIIQVGENQASCVYVRNKLKLAQELKIKGELIKLKEDIEENELISIIKKLNDSRDVNGILVQLPLPNHINENNIIETINPIKDVDCFCLQNVGKLWTVKKDFNGILPCTPAGVIEMLKRSNIEIKGKKVAIIGRSNIVGKPLAALCLLENATPIICHSQTQNLKQICQESDILIPCLGKAKFITKEFTNSKQVIIDVGINRDEEGKLCGDVDFENICEHVHSISPVPKGVGPMTIIMLSKNLIKVTKMQNNLK
ncbi:MAG: bifunctional methylenetetrahydrofolate dehydrogenase/methenyltetrahydrofolate cyclohydrolase [Mycoplasmataceae bacterium]|nr:bifunctional methylenetetrahydrofolate dehydrogenase/methenyltetrahydrofolate cyclohydrolase [Mycoplasmataceae bacterium]